MNKKITTKDLTISGIGIAAIISGGFITYQLGYLFPIPGMKYILMAPFLAAILYIITSVMTYRFSLLIMGVAFAGIMTIINLYMGLSILSTTILSALAQLLVPIANKPLVGAVAFPCFAGITGLFISKYMVGGVFLKIPNLWILGAGLCCLVFGFAGAWMAGRVKTQVHTAFRGIRDGSE